MCDKGVVALICVLQDVYSRQDVWFDQAGNTRSCYCYTDLLQGCFIKGRQSAADEVFRQKILLYFYEV